MPKRSEVYFGLRGEEWNNMFKAKGAGKPYYCFGDYPAGNVYLADLNRTKVCKVSDLEDAFPPTTPAPTSDTLGDRLLSTALRESREAKP